MFAISLLSHSLETILYLVIFLYIRNLKKIKCDCSKDWRREYLMWFFLVMAIYSAVMLIATIASWGPLDIPLAHSVVIMLILLVGLTLYMVFAIQYAIKLKKSQCQCSNGVSRDLMFLWGLALICLSVFSLLSIVSTGSALTSKSVKSSSLKLASEIKSSVAHPLDSAYKSASKVVKTLSRSLSASPKRR